MIKLQLIFTILRNYSFTDTNLEETRYFGRSTGGTTKHTQIK